MMERQVILEEQSSLPANPYCFGPPVTGDHFFGRDRVFGAVEACLRKRSPNVIVLYGQRRIGKTSVLHQLLKYRVPAQYHAVLLNLEGFAQKPKTAVLHALARTIASQMNLSEPSESMFEANGDYFRTKFLPRVYDTLDGKRLLLLFDEFEALSDEPQGDAAIETFFPYLRELIDKEPQLAFVLAIGRHINELPSHFKSFFKESSVIIVGLLTPQEAEQLITRPATPHLKYENEAIERIIDVTAGHPYCTQVVCFEIFNLMSHDSRNIVRASDVDHILNAAIDRARFGLEWLWDGLSPIDRAFLSAFASIKDSGQGVSGSEVQQTLRSFRIDLPGIQVAGVFNPLIEREIIRRLKADRYQFTVDFVRRWVALVHPVENAQQELEKTEPEITYLLGLAQSARALGRPARAENYYRQILAIRPSHTEALLGLAEVLYQEGDYDEALNEFEEAYAQDTPGAKSGLTRTAKDLLDRLEKRNQIDAALEVIQRVVKILPHDDELHKRQVDLLMTSAKVYVDQRRYIDAEKVFAEIMELPLSSETERQCAYSQLVETKTTRLKTIGTELESSGDLRGALQAYSELAVLHPEEPLWQEKTDDLTDRLEIDQLFKSALSEHKGRKWKEASSLWLDLLLRLKEARDKKDSSSIQHPVNFYQGMNVPLFLAEASSRVAHQYDAEIRLIPLYLDTDGQIQLAIPLYLDADGQIQPVIDENGDARRTKRYAVTPSVLKWLVLTSAIGFGMVGFILGMMSILILGNWAALGILVLVLLAVVVLRSQIPRLREEISELNTVGEIRL